MKIALICDSLLLDRSLEMYLKEFLTSYKLCDFVVATQKVESQKPVFLIGDFEDAQLKIPFTRELLLQELEKFYQSLQIPQTLQEEEEQIKAINQSSANHINLTHTMGDSNDFSQPSQTPTEDSTFAHFRQDSALNAKLEEILRRYTNEILETFLTHKDS